MITRFKIMELRTKTLAVIGEPISPIPVSAEDLRDLLDAANLLLDAIRDDWRGMGTLPNAVPIE
jgi:hypothetical protein